jgi:hypothetical protein
MTCRVTVNNRCNDRKVDGIEEKCGWTIDG